MEKLISAFEDTFGIHFSVLPLPEYELFPVSKSDSSELLFGSAAAVAKPILVQMEILHFEELCPLKYFLVGFWGHGANSYAFYYSRSDEWSDICFRLPYGGIYMDNDRASSDIARFLVSYFSFERQLIGCGYRLIAVESMWEGRYKLKTPEGEQFEHNGSLLRSADFTGFGVNTTVGTGETADAIAIVRRNKEENWTMEPEEISLKPEEIKKIREEMGWTQEELAEAFFVEPEKINQHRTKNPLDSIGLQIYTPPIRKVLF